MPTIPSQSEQGLRPFVFHGVHVNGRTSTNQATAQCPWCGRDDNKFYINVENSKWNCFACNPQGGNALDFLRLLWEESRKATTIDQYKGLVANRRLMSHETLEKWGLTLSILRDEWIIPGYYTNSKDIKQLYRYTDYSSKDGRKHLWATPTFDHCLYGVQLFDPKKEDVYICEGPFDAMALWEIMRTVKLSSTGQYEPTGSEESSLLGNANVLAVPSATTMNELWARLLTNKNVCIMFDNDHPKMNRVSGKMEEPIGIQGVKRITRQIISEWDIRPKSLSYLDWSDGHNTYDSVLTSGYDVRDMLSEGYDSSFLSGRITARITEIERRAKQLGRLINLIKPIPPQWYDPGHTHSGEPSSNGKGRYVGLSSLPCDKWVTLEDAMKKAYTWHSGLRKTLAVMLAVVTCTMRPKDQLWMKIVAPPSSGKTEMGNSIGTNGEYVKLKSNFTGFFSGVRQSKKDAATNGKKDDLGLLKEIMGKTFIVKDADTLLKNPNRERILAEMRDFYDGNTQTYFKLGTGREYHNIRVSVILIGTSSLYTLDAADLGDRFLTCCMGQLPRELSQRISKSSLMKMFSTDAFGVTDKPESMEDNETLKAKQLAAGYVDYLRRNADTLINKVQRSAANESIVSEIEALAEFMGMMRSRPSSKQDEQVEHELSIRATKQLGKLAVCLAVVLNKETVDREVMSIVREVALDTAAGSMLEITKYLHRHPHGADYSTLNLFLRHRDDKLKDNLRFMLRIGAFDLTTETTTGPIQGRYLYKLTPHMNELYERIFPSGSQ